MKVDRFRLVLLVAAVVAAPPRVAAGPLVTSFLYRLSSATGELPFSGARLSYDGGHDELYVIDDGGLVRVFNESGMEIFTFGDSPELGAIVAVAALESGELLTLSYFEGKPALLRCNFRGERLARLDIAGVPAEHAGFIPGQMRYARGHIYLADLGGMRLMVLDASGSFVRFFDIAPMIDVKEEERADHGLKGFNVDPAGNVLFTIQTISQAYVLSLDGKLRAFGRRGSGPGKFNVITGIAADELGNFYVADILKSAVIVFDKDFRFIREFGYRGTRPHNLVSPIDVATGKGRVFVSQYGRRGVSVFEVKSEP